MLKRSHPNGSCCCNCGVMMDPEGPSRLSLCRACDPSHGPTETTEAPKRHRFDRKSGSTRITPTDQMGAV